MYLQTYEINNFSDNQCHESNSVSDYVILITEA